MNRLLLRLLIAAVVSGPLASSPVFAQSAENVAVVINDASPASQRIGEYYIKKRGIPASNVIRLRTVTTEAIQRPEYLRTIEAPVAITIGRQSLHDRVLYLVLTKGVPLRVTGTGGQDGTVASVDSELSILYSRLVGRNIPLRGRVPNPYFLGTRSLREARPFTHREQEIFLVTRLDGFSVDEVLKLIDRSGVSSADGAIVLDQRAGLTDNTGDEWLAEAARRLQDQGQGSKVALDTSMNAAPPNKQVLGYYSWGSNDAANRRRRFGMGFVPGALAATFVSTDARTFEPPPDSWTPSSDWKDPTALFGGSPQTLIGDLIREGATGVAGHVAEPYLQSTVRPEILFPAYLSGFTLAEAFYLAIPDLSWQTVVVGDPLCRPFQRPTLSRADIEDPLDPQTDLPGLFSRRRLEVGKLTMKDIPEAAFPFLIAGDVRLSKGDIAGARAALERGTELAPNAAGAQVQLGQIYDTAREYPRAAERYRAAIKAQPKNVVALNNLAYLLAVRLNAVAEAHPIAKQAAALAPKNPTVLDTLAWIEHLTGNSEMAAKLLAISVRELPEHAEIRLHSAIVHAAIGDQKRSEADLAEALRLDPSLAKRDDVLKLQRAPQLKK